MKSLLLLLATFVLASTAPVRAEHTRVTNPSAVTAEIGGRGLLGGIYFDRVLNDDLAAGFGLGMVSLKDSVTETGSVGFLLPAYASYYFMRAQGAPFVSLGLTAVLNGYTDNRVTSVGGAELGSSPLMPSLGVGYENRGDSGFLFRATAYVMWAGKLLPWLGVAFGYAF